MGFECREKLFIAGNRIRDNEVLFDKQVTYELKIKEIEYYPKNNDYNEKLYKVISKDLNDDYGKLRLYLKFHIKSNQSLYVEARFFAQPLKSKEFNQFKDWKIFEVKDKHRLKESFINAIGNLMLGVFSPFIGLIELIDFLSQKRGIRKLKEKIDISPNYDFGAKQSVNSLITGTFDDFCSDKDFIMEMKIVEKSILNTIEDFLAEHNIDTKEFRDRETSILNNTVNINSSVIKGDVQAGNRTKIKNKE